MIKLQAGDRVLLASDGVSEAISPAGEQFGTDRMAAIVGDHALSAERVVDRHRQEMTAHCGSERRTDDVTILCIDRVETLATPSAYHGFSTPASDRSRVENL